MRMFNSNIAAALVVATFSLPVLPAGAQGIKVGIVDMKRVFSEYHKTKSAEQAVNEGKASAKKELDERLAKYKQLLEKFQEFDALIRDEAISEEKRDGHKKEAQDVAAEAKSLEREMAKFRERRERMLQEQVMRMRKGILEEITAIVETNSATQGYNLVFDKSGLSMNAVPFLLHSKDAVDFSNEIIAELNKEAPAPAGN